MSISSQNPLRPESISFPEQTSSHQQEQIFQCLSVIFQINLSSFEECLSSIANATSGQWNQLISAHRSELDQLVDEKGRSLLMQAISKGYDALSQQLIEHKIGFRQKDTRGNTPLHIAARSGQSELVGCLWRHFEIDSLNSKNKTPLYKAIKAGQSDVVAALVENGANLKTHLPYKTLHVTPLAYAVIRGEIECVQILAQKAQFTEHHCSLGSLLHLAVHFQQNEVLDYLLQKGEQQCKPLLESRDAAGNTPLAHAVIVENLSALSLLQLRGANLETQNNKGHTPLHLAALAGSQSMIESLAFLQCRIDPTDHDHKRPIDLVKAEAKEITALLSNLMKQKTKIETRPPHYGYAPPQNLVFKGGGPKGIAYIGVLKALEEQKVLPRVLRVAGTSAGAINSALLAVGFSVEETEILLKKTDLASFLDHPFTTENLKVSIQKNLSLSGVWKAFQYISNGLKNPVNLALDPLKKLFSSLWHCTGICEGETLRLWIENQIRAKTGIEYCTFAELRQAISNGKPLKHLHMFATRIGPNPTIFHFSSEDKECDQMIISDAVRASLSIPGAFKPHNIHEKIEGKRVCRTHLGQFADGGLLYNLPIETFDEKKYILQGLSEEEGRCPMFNKRTLGFSLYDAKGKISPPNEEEITTVVGLIQSILSLYSSAEDLLRQQNPYNQHRIIEIDNQGVGLLEFSLSEEKKNLLIKSGFKATQAFYEKHTGSMEESSLFYYPRLSKQIKGSLSIRQVHPHFIGRASLLQEIQTKLKTHPQLVLFGPGGIGKTELAIAYANKHLENYSLIWTIHCRSEEESLTSYRELAHALKVPLDGKESLHDIERKVHRKLEQNPAGEKPWLLLYDDWNAKLQLPQRGGHVLLTACAKEASIPSLQVLPFSEEESLELIKKITQKTVSKDTLAKLTQFCGRYPLLLGRVAAYVSRIPGETLESYLQQQEGKQELLALPPDQRYQKSVREVIQHTLQALPIQVQNWLKISAYLDPTSIPLSYLSQWLQLAYPEEDKASLLRSQRDLLIVLSEHAIQQREGDYLSMYPLFHEALQIVETGENQKLAVDLLLKMGKSWKEFEAAANWKQVMKEASIWREHYQFLQRKTNGLQSLTNEQRADLLDFLGCQTYQIGLFDEAIKHCQAALDRRTANNNPAQIAASHAHLGLCYQAKGEYDTAIDQYTKALASTDERDRAEGLNRRGICYYEKGLHEEAIQDQLEALKTQEKLQKEIEIRKKDAQATQNQPALLKMQEALLENQRDQGKSYSSLGLCYEKKRDYPRAIEYHTKALDIRKDLQKNPLDIAESYNNLALCYKNTRKFEEAQQSYQKALDIGRDMFQDHPKMAMIWQNRGFCWLAEKGPSNPEVKNCFHRAYEICKVFFGEGHDKTKEAYDIWEFYNQ